MPTRTGYGAPQRPYRPQHKPRPEQNQIPRLTAPHAAEPTRKPLVTRESLLGVCLYETFPLSMAVEWGLLSPNSHFLGT